ncbi:MAG: TraR/DksA family transcriptional regulator [Nitrospiria bacterium]
MDEPNINPNDFKDKLLTLREELLALEESDKDGAKPVALDQSRVGRLSRMDALQMQEMSKEAKRRRAIQLQRIEGALQRIERGRFGLCIKCEEVIQAKRLAFDPTAFLCIGCARENEQ